MSFAPPPGPPPPSVPEGWKAQFDDRYKQWFFVDLQTGRSQWEPPAAPTPQEPLHTRVSEAPPSYEDSRPGNLRSSATSEKTALGSNNPYGDTHASTAVSSTMDSDARLAAQLQAEEDARARDGRSPGSMHKPDPGASADYYADVSRPQAMGYSPSPGAGAVTAMAAPESSRSRSKGFLSKLMGKSSSSSGGQPSYGRPPPPPPQSYGYPPQAGYYGGYPQQPGYGYTPTPGQGGFYPMPPAQAQRRRHGGMGMGAAAGAAALGVGGGLIGGALLADAIDDHDHDDYGGGDDWGGGDDFGGGDF